MSQYRGKPCEVCASQGRYVTSHTVGHHVLPVGRCNFHRYSPECICVVCPEHHALGNDIAAHSTNALAVRRWLIWLYHNKQEQWLWMQEHEWDQGKLNYRQIYFDLCREHGVNPTKEAMEYAPENNSHR